MEIVFDVDGQIFPISEQRAAVLSEELRLAARGQRGEYGRAGALAIHELLEDRLTNESGAPIPLEGVAAVAVFYILKMSLEATPFYDAVAAVRDRWLETGGDEPLYCASCGRSPSEDETSDGWHRHLAEVFEYPFCPDCDREYSDS